MILYQNSLLKLDYQPADNLLEVIWPNLEPYSLPEARMTLSRLVNTIRTYDIKNLLIDASQGKSTVNPEQYEGEIQHFLEQISQTNLQRIARVKSEDTLRENKADSLKAAELPFTFRNFSSRPEALEWLKNSGMKLPD